MLDSLVADLDPPLDVRLGQRVTMIDRAGTETGGVAVLHYERAAGQTAGVASAFRKAQQGGGGGSGGGGGGVGGAGGRGSPALSVTATVASNTAVVAAAAVLGVPAASLSDLPFDPVSVR